MSEPPRSNRQRRQLAPDEWPDQDEWAGSALGPPISQPTDDPWWESPVENTVPAAPDPIAPAPPAPAPATATAPPVPAPATDAPIAAASPVPAPPAQRVQPAAAAKTPPTSAATTLPSAPAPTPVTSALGPSGSAVDTLEENPSGPVDPNAADAVPAPGPSRGFLDGAAGTLIVAALLIRGWAAWGGFFSLDDFAFARLAAEKGLGSALLFTPYNSHFMPGAYLLVWLETTIAPLDYRVVAGVDLALIAVSFVLSWLLIRRLAGPRLVALIPLTVVLVSPITLPATLWWAVSINQLVMLIAIPGALLAQVAYVRTGKGRYGAIAVLVALLAVPFYEKAVLVVPLIFAMTVLLQPNPELFDRLMAALRRHRAQWIAFALFALVYGGVYLTRPLDRKGDQAVDLGGLLGNAATNSVPSGLLGGPWSWKAIGAVDASANPPVVGRVIAVVIIAAVIGLTVYRRPLAWQAWALLGGGLVFDVLVLAVGRLQLGSGAAMEFRYFSDLVPIAAIALCLALVGPPEWAAHWPQRANIEWPPVVGGTRLAVSNANALVLPLVVALFISGLVSTVKYSDRWHANPAKEYTTNAEKSIEAMGRPIDLYNGMVPEKVVWGVLNPTNFPSRMLAPLKLPIKADPDVSTDLYVLNSKGVLSHASVTSAKVPPGTVKNCGYRVAGKRTGMLLDRTLFNWWWYAELHYTAAETTQVTFNSANTLGKHLTFAEGTHTLWVKVYGPAAWISFDNVPKSAGICLSSATVGLALPSTPATP